MRVRYYPADEAGCGHYRLHFPARVLASMGHDVAVGDEITVRIADERPCPKVVTLRPPDADVVVFQRPAGHQIADSIPLLQEAGIAVVVDIDDDFEAVHPGNAAFRGYHPAYSPRHNWQHARRAAAAADVVTVTTPQLAERYGSRTVVLPNYVPESYLKVDGARDELLVGWTGIIGTHPADLDVIRRCLRSTIEDAGASFLAIGGAGVLDHLDVPGRYEPWRPLLSGYAELVASLSVGLVPLADSRFNAAKSSLKASEYAALGVVPVMSPTPDNLRLHRLGVGLIAKRPREWQRHIRHLLADDAYRADMAAQARAAMSDRTYERRAQSWLDAWTAAYERRQRVG